jgi:hypothetical protein
MLLFRNVKDSNVVTGPVVTQKRKAMWTPPPKPAKRVRKYVPLSKPPAMVFSEYCSAKAIPLDSVLKELPCVDGLFCFSAEVRCHGIFESV